MRTKLEAAIQISNAPAWPDRYRNARSGRVYAPHHEMEQYAVFEAQERFILLRGGEGSGKTTAGAIMLLERLKRGMMRCAAAAPNLPHFKRSTWPELRDWIPWDQVVERHRYRRSHEWEVSQQFLIAFLNGSELLCGGIENEGSWEGPNLHFFWFDEARHKPDDAAIKVMNGRIRMPGPQGEVPQIAITTTPRTNWLFDWFGPVNNDHGDDPHLSVKQRLCDVVMLTKDNLTNLDAGYVEDRAAGLTGAEQRVLLEGAWEDVDNPLRFLDSLIWWDNCHTALPPLGREPMTLAMDAGVSNDSFGVVGVTRHPDPVRRDTDIAVRYVGVWYPQGDKLDFGAPEAAIRQLCQAFNVVQIAYDPYQLHDMATRLQNEGVAWCKEFNQGAARLEADKQLLDLILRQGVAHDGNPELRKHLDHADRKMDSDHRRLRIVKRHERQKVDLAVALSMAAAECLRLNL